MATTTLFSLLTNFRDVSNGSGGRVQSGNLAPALPSLHNADMLAQIKQLEKRTFPKNEAMDFEAELKKRNTELIVVLDTSPPSEAISLKTTQASRRPPKSLLDSEKNHDPSSKDDTLSLDQTSPTLIVAYVLHARSAGTSLVHKVCVAEKYRRRGIARQLLTMPKTKLEGQGCERIQLWVDWQRDSAIDLYKSVGFRRVDGARDYYGVDRHGIKMVMDLNWVW